MELILASHALAASSKAGIPRTKVADLTHRLDMRSPSGAAAAGLEASVVLKPKAGERFAFIARIRNRDGWSRWTERVEVSAEPPPRPLAPEPVSVR